MTPSNDPLSITICGKPAQANQYSLIFSNDTVPADIAWYKAHLPGYHMVHAFWDNRSQDTFFSPDGTKGVNITGTPKSDKAVLSDVSQPEDRTHGAPVDGVQSVQSIVQVRSASFSNFLNRRLTMKFFRTLMMLVSLGVMLSAGNATLTTATRVALKTSCCQADLFRAVH